MQHGACPTAVVSPWHAAISKMFHAFNAFQLIILNLSGIPSLLPTRASHPPSFPLHLLLLPCPHSCPGSSKPCNPLHTGKTDGLEVPWSELNRKMMDPVMAQRSVHEQQMVVLTRWVVTGERPDICAEKNKRTRPWCSNPCIAINAHAADTISVRCSHSWQCRSGRDVCSWEDKRPNNYISISLFPHLARCNTESCRTRWLSMHGL